MDNNSAPPASGTVRLESAFSLFKPSMDAVAINLGSLVGLLLLPIIPMILLVVLFLLGGANKSASAIFFSLAGLLIIAFYAYVVLSTIAIVVISLASARGQQMKMKAALKASLPYFWRYLGLGIVLLIITVISLILFIIPFFFVLKRYYLAAYYLIDRNVGIGEAMRLCAADSKRYSGGIWGLIGVSFLISLPNVIPFIGAIATFVLYVMYLDAPAIRYLEIKGERAVPVEFPMTPVGPMPPASSPGMPPQTPMPQIQPAATPPQQPAVSPTPPAQPPTNPPRPLIQ